MIFFWTSFPAIRNVIAEYSSTRLLSIRFIMAAIFSDRDVGVRASQAQADEAARQRLERHAAQIESPYRRLRRSVADEIEHLTVAAYHRSRIIRRALAVITNRKDGSP